MKIGILSDIHDNLRHLVKIIDELNEAKIDLLVFCGDWDMPFTMRMMTKLNCPIKAVLGNGDPDIQKFEYQLQNLDVLKTMKIDLHHRFQDFEFGGKRIGVFHGDDEALNKFIIESQLFDLFCVGHEHQPKIEKQGKTLVVNPGTLIGYRFEKGIEPITYAIYDTELNNAEIIELKED